MAESTCLSKLLSPEIFKSVFGDKNAPSAKLLAEIDEHIQGIKREYPHDFERRMQKYYRELRLKHDQDIMDLALQAKAVLRGVDRVKAVGYKGKEFKAIQSFFDSPPGVLAKGMDVNVKGYTGHFLNEWETLFLGQLQKNKLIDLVENSSPEFDLEVKKAKWNLVEGKDIYKGLSDEAKQVAQIHWDLTKKMLSDQQEHGIAIGNYKNYMHPQSVSAEKILALAETKEDRVIKFYNFLKGVDFDREAFFGPKNVGVVEKELAGVRDYLNDVLRGEIGEGVIPSKDIGEVIYAVPNGVDLGKKLAYSRRLRFNDPVSQHAFDTQFGNGNLFENTLEMISGKAKALSLVKMFGSNPKEGFLKIVDQAHSTLQNTNPSEARKLKVGANYSSEVMKLIDNALGNDAVPVNQLLAKATERTSQYVDLTKLGNVGISSIPSFALGASVIRDRTGKGLLSSTFDMMNGWLKNMTPAQREANLRRFAQVGQTFMDQMNRVMSEGQVENGFRRLGKFQSVVSGLRMINNAVKATVAETISRDVGSELSKSVERMSPNIKATLMRAGFELEDISLLKGAVEDGVLTKEGIGKLVDSPDFAARAKARGYTKSQYVSELQANYGSMLNVAANLASSTGGPLETISWFFGHGGTQAGTPLGSILRLRSKYTSFLGAVMRQMSQSAKSAPDEKLLLAGELRAQGFQFWAPAASVVMLTALGYATGVAQDLLKGKNPKDPENPDTWKDALIQGGGGGVYAQYLLTEFDKFGRGRGTATALAGPVFGEALPVFDLVKRSVIGGEEMTPANQRQITRFMRSNLPLQNLIGLKHFVDYMHYDIIDEYLEPGSSMRRERNIQNLESGSRLDFPFEG